MLLYLTEWFSNPYLGPRNKEAQRNKGSPITGFVSDKRNFDYKSNALSNANMFEFG